jgi:hypothetical protein
MKSLYSEIEVRRPDGQIEIVLGRDPFITATTWRLIQKNTRAAGRGECLRYWNREAEVADTRTPAEIEWAAVEALYAKANRAHREDGRDEFENCGRAGSLAAKAIAARDAWSAKYPREAALRKANIWAGAANYGKAGAGERAAKRIEAGEDYKLALAEMRAEWAAYVHENTD